LFSPSLAWKQLTDADGRCLTFLSSHAVGIMK